MGTTLHYVGDFNDEVGQLNKIETDVKKELEAMKATLEGMPAYWKDEKSAQFITDSNNYILEVQKKMAEAVAAGKETLEKVAAVLKIYQ